MAGAPEDYVEVKDRIVAFYDKYPEGSLRCKNIKTQQVGDATFLIYVAQAWRSPDDPAPAEGAAWEPVPGKTNFTRDSELMNAETSAWGRAIVALGFDAHRGIASANEVRNRQGGNGSGSQGRVEPSEKQLDFMDRLAKKGGANGDEVALLRSYAGAVLTGGRDGSLSKVIDLLNGDQAGETLARMVSKAEEWVGKESDVPADTDGLEPKPATATADADVPF